MTDAPSVPSTAPGSVESASAPAPNAAAPIAHADRSPASSVPTTHKTAAQAAAEITRDLVASLPPLPAEEPTLTAQDLLGEPDAEGNVQPPPPAPTASADASAETDEPDADAAPATPPRELAAKFALADADGNELDAHALADIAVTFKANDGDRTMPLDRVIRLAQRGFHNETIAAEIAQYRQERPQLEAQMQSVHQENAALRQAWERVLAGDDDLLVAEREEFARYQSPEMRAARAEQALLEQQRQQQVQQQQAVVQQQAASFAGDIAQRFDALAQQYPNVSSDEIIGRFTTLTAPLMRQGQLPPEAFDHVRHLIDFELVPFVESRAEAMGAAKPSTPNAPPTPSRTTPQPPSPADAALHRARAEAAKAKRQIARAVRPASGSAPAAGQPNTASAPVPEIKTADDFRKAIPSLIQQARQGAA